MKLLPCAATAGLFASILLAPAQAASVARTYSYFSVGGSTLSELQDELAIHGPKLASTGSRHPGATEMEFTNRITYKEAQAAKRIVSPGERIVFQYTTSSTSLQKKLGVA